MIANSQFFRIIGNFKPNQLYSTISTHNQRCLGDNFLIGRAKQKCPSETHSVTFVPGLSTFSDLSRIVEHTSCTAIPLLKKGHLHTINPAQPRSPSYPSCIFI